MAPANNDSQTTSESTSQDETSTISTSQCDEVIKLFRSGQVTRGSAAAKIFAILLQTGSGLPEEQITSAYETYLDTLELHEKILRAAGEQGNETAQPDRANVGPGGTGEAVKETQRGNKGEKRARSHSPESGERLIRKLPVDEDMYPWTQRAKLAAEHLSPNLELSRRLIINFATDIKNAKLHLSSTPGVPRFPDTEWTNILTGKPVNLDIVFSGAYAVSVESQTVERIGDIELRTGPAKPAKLIRTSGDWLLAWQKTVTATKFAFPHREGELTRYTEYMLGLFGSRRTSSHTRIIEMDKAVRKHVAESNDLELCDFTAIRHFEPCFLDPDGAQFESEMSRAKPKRRAEWNPEEPCRQYNENRCARTNCKFKHVCLFCGGAHRKGECKEKAKRGA